CVSAKQRTGPHERSGCAPRPGREAGCRVGRGQRRHQLVRAALPSGGTGRGHDPLGQPRTQPASCAVGQGPLAARHRPYRAGRRRAVGCGFGAAAEFVASLGFNVVAFDISPTAIDGARGRFPGSSVDYPPGDLLTPPASWRGAFDLVVEIYTVQPLHGAARTAALSMLPRLVAPGGTLLIIAHATEESAPDRDPASFPWPLTRAEIDSAARLLHWKTPPPPPPPPPPPQPTPPATTNPRLPFAGAPNSTARRDDRPPQPGGYRLMQAFPVENSKSASTP